MLLGYVSDERHVALDDVHVEIEHDGQTVAVVNSTPRGAIVADIAPGAYRVTLVKPGFGSKRVEAALSEEQPYQFRLLSDDVVGYVWPRWAKSGDKAEFRVHSHEQYRLSLWRYGLKREFVRLHGWFDEHGPNAVMQITPDGDYTQTGVRFNKVGYGSPHHTQMSTAPEKSGLYYFHAKSASGKFFSFPWIVAPATPQAPIAVLASSNSWNAYNNFGGRSNYVNSNGLPAQPVVNARQDLLRYTTGGTFNEWGFPDDAYPPLSFERPELGNTVGEDEEVTDPIAGRLQSGMAPAEWRLLGWLERENFTYDFYADHQLHSGELDLDAYKILIFSVHPEYWSRPMYEKVKAWVYERGGRVMYLGGNGLNCEVVFPDDSTMRCKTNLNSTGGELGMVDADDPGIYYESRFHRTFESEANLLGVVTTASGIMTAAPYKAINTDNWVYSETGLQNGDLFGELNLQERVPGGASGHETDKISASSPANIKLLAKGINPDDGGAEMTFYTTNSGGAVFSVGSITWVASLLVDPHVSRITRNVITRFLSGEAL